VQNKTETNNRMQCGRGVFPRSTADTPAVNTAHLVTYLQSKCPPVVVAMQWRCALQCVQRLLFLHLKVSHSSIFLIPFSLSVCTQIWLLDSTMIVGRPYILLLYFLTITRSTSKHAQPPPGKTISNYMCVFVCALREWLFNPAFGCQRSINVC